MAHIKTTPSSAATTPSIKVWGLRKSYGRTQAVAGVDLEVAAGEVLALLGPNGAGKTTTVEILEGFQRPDAGNINVLGWDPARAGVWLRDRIGVVLQKSAVDPYLTVVEALEQRVRYYRQPRQVDELLTFAGLDQKASARIRSLSGGQQRRLDLALAIAGNPEVLFLDEPTTGFDPSARRETWGQVRRLADDGVAVLLTTHYMEEAQALADRVVVMRNGKKVAEGTPSSLASSRHTVVRFELPSGVQPPAGVSNLREADGVWELDTDHPTIELHALTSWAIQNGLELSSLTVARPTLEAVYLELTQREESI